MTKKQKKQNSPVTKIAIMCVAVVALVVASAIFASDEKTKVVIDIKAGSQANTGGLTLSSSGDVYTIKYLNENKSQEFFKIDTGQMLAKELGHSNTGNGRHSPFFDCEKRGNRRIINIILDVSGSVLKENFQNGSLGKIEDIINDIKMQPGDQFDIRFLGENASIEGETIYFAGPKIDYEKKYNSVQNTHTIDLTGYSLESEIQGCGVVGSDGNTGMFTTQLGIFNKINSLYEKRIGDSDSHTRIFRLLENVANDVASNKSDYSSAVYILLTDGHATGDNIECGDLLLEDAEKCGEKLKGLRISDENDKAVIIGVDSDNKREVFRKLFNGITINFQ